jgi:exosortase A
MKVFTSKTSNLPLVGLVVVCAVVIAVYWGTFTGMASMWTLSSFRHGYVISAISVVLLLRNRRAFVAEPWTGSWLGLLLAGSCVFMWLLAHRVLVQAVEFAAVLGILGSSVLAVVGLRAFRPIVFPLGYLFLALPVGDALVPYLMRITADVSVHGLNMVGLPVLREGMIVTLPNGTFEVADACSGFRYLNAGLALGVLVAHELFRGFWRQASYVAAVAIVFVLTNALRAFVVMLVASGTHMKVFAGVDHMYFGWVLFLVAMVGMYWLAERFSNRDSPNER